MTDTNADKKSLRRMVRQRKAALTAEQKQAEAEAVFAAIEAQPKFACAHSILLYHSLPDELPTHDVLQRWCATKLIFLPRVKGDDMEIVHYDGILVTDNPFGIAEPAGEPYDGVVDLAIVPAVGVDRNGNRLGRGGGYYDRWLGRHKCRAAWVVALDCQLLDAVPAEPHDALMGGVFTPSFQKIFQHA